MLLAARVLLGCEAESKRWERSALSASEEALLGGDRVLMG
jgi:hypothetical protein